MINKAKFEESEKVTKLVAKTFVQQIDCSHVVHCAIVPRSSIHSLNHTGISMSQERSDLCAGKNASFN